MLIGSSITRGGFISLFSFLFIAVATQVTAAEPLRIGLSVPGQGDYTPLFVAANELGYFKQANLDVEITEYQGGAAAQEALSAGAADVIAYFPGGMAIAVSKGVNQRVIGSIIPVEAGWYMLVPPDSPIHSPSDLRGKKVGITVKGSLTDMLALWTADDGGVDILTVPVGGGGLVPNLKRKQVDAVVAFPPVSLQLLASGDGRVLIDYGTAMPPFMPDCWVASQATIDKRGNDLRQMMAQFGRAAVYMQHHKEQALGWLKQYTKQEDQKVLELIFRNSTMLTSLDAAFEDKWIDTSLQLSAKTYNMPELLKLKASDVSTHSLTPVKFE